MLEQLPAPSQVGKTKVGGIDLNKPRMRWVIEAVIACRHQPMDLPLPQLAASGPRAQQAKPIRVWPPPRRL